MSTIEDRLHQLGWSLPKAAAPVANYVPGVAVGPLLAVSGQLAYGADGALAPRHKGKIGAGVSAEDGTEAARLCALNLLAQAKAVLGDLDRIKRCVRLGGFINCTPDYGAIAPIMNGASDLMVAALGDAGRHARSTIGVAELPFSCCVEVEAMFEIVP